MCTFAHAKDSRWTVSNPADTHGLWHVFLDILISGDRASAEHLYEAASMLLDAVEAREKGDTEGYMELASMLSGHLSEV